MEVLHLVAASCLSHSDFGSNASPDHLAVATKVRDRNRYTLRKAYLAFEVSGLPWEGESTAKQLMKDAASQLVVSAIKEWPGFRGYLEEPRLVVRESGRGGGEGHTFLTISPLDERSVDSVMDFAEENLRDIMMSNQAEQPLGWTKEDQQRHVFHAMAVMDRPGARILNWRKVVTDFIKRGLTDDGMSALRARAGSLSFDITAFAIGAEGRLGVEFFPPSYHEVFGNYIHGGFVKKLPGGGFILAFENGVHLMLLPSSSAGAQHVVLAHAGHVQGFRTRDLP